MKNFEDRLAELKSAKGKDVNRATAKPRPPGVLSARERILELVDRGTVQELVPLAEHQCRDFGMDKVKIPRDGVITGQGKVEGRPIFIFAQDSTVAGGSVGVVHAQKVCQTMDLAVSTGAPIIGLLDSVGARMQEGIYSLMQLAKTSAVLARLHEAGIPYLSILTDPTTGGTTASFAMLGDVNLAEPGALIGFAGPRVIEETIKQELPAGFQRSEFLLEHGMLDGVVDRRDMKSTVALLLRHMWAGWEAPE